MTYSTSRIFSLSLSAAGERCYSAWKKNLLNKKPKQQLLQSQWLSGKVKIWDAVLELEFTLESGVRSSFLQFSSKLSCFLLWRSSLQNWTQSHSVQPRPISSIASALIYTDKNKIRNQLIMLPGLLYVTSHSMSLHLETWVWFKRALHRSLQSSLKESLPQLITCTFPMAWAAPRLGLCVFQLDFCSFCLDWKGMSSRKTRAQLILWISPITTKCLGIKSHMSLHKIISIIILCVSGKRSLWCNEMVFRSCFH